MLSANYFQNLPALLHRLPILWAALPLLLLSERSALFRQYKKFTLEKTRKRIASGDGARRQDFFAQLLKDGDLPEDLLAAHASILIIAGAETTATTMSGALCFLAQNPACFRQLKDEVRGAFRDSNEITGDSTVRLPYLNAVIEESLRYCPAVAFGLPRDSPGEFIDGEYIPKGIRVSTDMFLMSRDPRNFDEPGLFNPNRWLDKRNANTERMRAFGFTIGPRSCIGQTLAYLEMRIVLAKLVYALDWELVDPDVDLIKQSKYYSLWSRPKLMVRFSHRCG